jgi:hypothetical protein
VYGSIPVKTESLQRDHELFGCPRDCPTLVNIIDAQQPCAIVVLGIGEARYRRYQ